MVCFTPERGKCDPHFSSLYYLLPRIVPPKESQKGGLFWNFLGKTTFILRIQLSLGVSLLAPRSFLAEGLQFLETVLRWFPDLGRYLACRVSITPPRPDRRSPIGPNFRRKNFIELRGIRAVFQASVLMAGGRFEQYPIEAFHQFGSNHAQCDSAWRA